MKTLPTTALLSGILSVFPACAGLGHDADSTLWSTTLGASSDYHYLSTIGFFDLEGDHGKGGYYGQFPFLGAAWKLLVEDDPFWEDGAATGAPYHHTIPMVANVGTIFPITPTLATYIGVGVGFTHEEWAVESSTPGVLKEFDSTGNLEFNMNGGVFWRFADGFSLQVHHDSAFQATSFGLIFWNS